MFPAGFEDGQMYVNTAYGDYPHYLPDVEVADHKHRFTGWMLLSKDKQVKTNSMVSGVKHNIIDENEQGYTLEQEAPDYDVARINDENLRTLWVAASNSDSIYVEMDLGRKMTINAFQINFQDFNAHVFGKPDTVRQQFLILISPDGKKWEVAVDYSKNQKDKPHAYLELSEPVQARFVRYQNIYFPNQYLAIGEFRIFGNGNGKLPKSPGSFQAVRQEDERNADLRWDEVKDAMGYVLYWGIREDRLNNSAMIYDKNSYELRALNKGQRYYYQVEAFNENGISERTKILKTE